MQNFTGGVSEARKDGEFIPRRAGKLGCPRRERKSELGPRGRRCGDALTGP